MNDNKMTPLERKATWGLGTVFSLRMLGMFMVLPVLTTYGLQLQHATESLIGLAIGIYGLTQAVFQIPFGIFSDKFGRKPMIVFGLIILLSGALLRLLVTIFTALLLVEHYKVLELYLPQLWLYSPI